MNSADFERTRPRLRLQQRGNALIYALLALAIIGMAMAGYMSSKQVEYKTQIGQAAATVLDTLRNATNNAISANMTALSGGLALTVNGVSVPPVLNALNEPTWTLSADQLRQMGYLPSGWTTTAPSVADGAAYIITFRRNPATCLPASFDCNVDGLVVIDRPLTDGVIIGPMLTKLGADGGVSLAASPGLPGIGPWVLQGFNNTWAEPNPVSGTPTGVVGVRVGTQSSAWANFVRIGDLRDPSLAGNLTMAGNLDVLRTATFRGAVTANAPVTLANVPLTVLGASGAPCVSAEAGGRLTVGCTGAINAETGEFTTRVSTNTIQVNPGDFLIRRGPSGYLVRVNDAGDMDLAGGITATRTVAAPDLVLNSPVRENDLCIPTTIATLDVGGLAVCSPTGVYRGVVRYGISGTACAVAGGIGVDSNNGSGLVCRGGAWVPVNELSSNFTLMSTITVAHGSAVPMPTCRNSAPSQPLLFILPSSEVTTARSFFRSATVNTASARASNGIGYEFGGEWGVLLVDGAGTPLQDTNAIAMTYCYYP